MAGTADSVDRGYAGDSSGNPPAIETPLTADIGMVGGRNSGTLARSPRAGGEPCPVGAAALFAVFSQPRPLEEISPRVSARCLARGGKPGGGMVSKPPHGRDGERRGTGCCIAGFRCALKTPPSSCRRCSGPPRMRTGWWRTWIFVFSTTPGRRCFRPATTSAPALSILPTTILLASEARMAVFIAAAKGEVSQEAWFHLGRPLTSCLGERVLFRGAGRCSSI